MLQLRRVGHCGVGDGDEIHREPESIWKILIEVIYTGAAAS